MFGIVVEISSKQYYSFLISFYQFRHECLNRRNNSLYICCHLWFYLKVLQKISVRIWIAFDEHQKYGHSHHTFDFIFDVRQR